MGIFGFVEEYTPLIATAFSLPFISAKVADEVKKGLWTQVHPILPYPRVF